MALLQIECFSLETMGILRMTEDKMAYTKALGV